MPGEIHVSSLIVHARPETAAAVEAGIEGIEGAEVRAAQEGRLVVVLETRDEQAILDRMHRIGDLPGVVSTSLIFHQVETADSEEGEPEP